MPSKQSRRRFLATGGLTSAVAIAGCLGRRTLAPATERSDTTPRPTNTPESTPVPAADRDRYSEDDREYRGDLLHDPDDWSGWTAHSGTVAETTETAFVGTTSMLLEDEDGSALRCAYTVPEGRRDFRNRGLCAAVRWDLPDQGAKFQMLVADGDGNRLWATANALGSHAHSDDEWVMTEFGISELIDDVFVDLTDVREVQLVFPNGPAAGTRVFVDNVRTVPYEPRRGAVLFTADDGRPSQLSVMRPVLREHDFPSVHFNMMGAGEHDHMSVAEQRTLAEEDGCYVCPHPQHPTPLPNMSDEESMVALQNEYEYVATESGLGLGHEHARFMSWPYGKSDAGTIRQAKEFYELGFDGVDRATTAWRSAAPMSVMRASFDSLEDLTDALDIAEHYGRVLIPQFHRLRETEPTGGTNITPDDFRAFVADVASRDVDVISVAEFAAVHQN